MDPLPVILTCLALTALAIFLISTQGKVQVEYPTQEPEPEELERDAILTAVRRLALAVEDLTRTIQRVGDPFVDDEEDDIPHDPPYDPFAHGRVEAEDYEMVDENPANGIPPEEVAQKRTCS